MVPKLFLQVILDEKFEKVVSDVHIFACVEFSAALRFPTKSKQNEVKAPNSILSSKFRGALSNQ